MNKKRRSAKEVIEGTPQPDKEHIFIKYFGEEPIDITDYSKISRANTATDFAKRDRIYDERHRRRLRAARHGTIHTHPTEPNFYDNNFWQRMKLRSKGIGPRAYANQKNTIAIPSAGDLIGFFKDYEENMTIAVRNSKTGEVLGYRVVKRTKSTPYIDLNTFSPFSLTRKERREFYHDINEYRKDCRTAIKRQDYQKVNESFESIAKKYHLKSRLIPTEDYEPNQERTTFVKKKGLEKVVGAALIIILLGIYLLYPNLTGNAISYSAPTPTNMIFWALAIIVVIGLILWLKRRR